MHRLALIVSLAASLALPLGCAPAGGAMGANDEPGSASAAVIGGASDSTHEGVVAIVRADGSTCSGVVIASQVVLTAGHCTFGFTAEDLEIRVGADATASTQRLPVARVVAYPTASLTSDDELGGVDLAALVTSAPLPTAPVPLATSIEDADLKGHVVTAIGYGRSVAADPASVGRRLAASVVAASVCSRVFRIGDDVTNVCFGDSGGAVLLDGALVGLVVAGLDGCKTPSAVTRLRAHRVWLERVVAGSYDAPCPECVTPDPACSAPVEATATPSSVEGGGCAFVSRRPVATPLGLLLVFLLSRLPRRASRRNCS